MRITGKTLRSSATQSRCMIQFTDGFTEYEKEFGPECYDDKYDSALLHIIEGFDRDQLIKLMTDKEEQEEARLMIQQIRLEHNLTTKAA